MTPFAELLQQRAGSSWLFIARTILLGALHGLEPGHSKTVTAAFIVALPGVSAHVVPLGPPAIVSHMRRALGFFYARLIAVGLDVGGRRRSGIAVLASAQAV